jgi:hypothetical protein
MDRCVNTVGVLGLEDACFSLGALPAGEKPFRHPLGTVGGGTARSQKSTGSGFTEGAG